MVRATPLQRLPTPPVDVDAAACAMPTVESARDVLVPCIAAEAPHADLASSYLAQLLRGERHQAAQAILAAADGGVRVEDLYLHVFQPALREVGRLWQLNQVSVAQEHYFTAATQLIMSQLYPRIFAAAKNGRTLVATCVAGDLHEIGVRMVADFFELAGWDTYYLGGNVPHDSIVGAIAEHRADVVAISATLPEHVDAVAQLIAAIRAAASPRVHVQVGGYPFLVAPDRWREVGADGTAADARAAIAAANAWLAQA